VYSKETEEHLLLNCTLHSALRVDLMQSVKSILLKEVCKIYCQVCYTIILDRRASQLGSMDPWGSVVTCWKGPHDLCNQNTFAICINLNAMCKLSFVSDWFFGYLLGSTELSEKAWWSTDENELKSPVLHCCSFFYLDILRLKVIKPTTNICNAVSKYLELTIVNNRFTSP